MELVEFLLARIAEDEAVALEAMGYESRVSVSPSKSAAHYARWDPDRVYAECEAKRRIVTEFGFQCSEYGAPGSELRAERQAFADEMGYRFEPHWPEEYAGFCDGCAAAQSADNGHARVLRILAAPYADHPDYRSEWAP